MTSDIDITMACDILIYCVFSHAKMRAYDGKKANINMLEKDLLGAGCTSRNTRWQIVDSYFGSAGLYEVKHPLTL